MHHGIGDRGHTHPPGTHALPLDIPIPGPTPRNISITEHTHSDPLDTPTHWTCPPTGHINPLDIPTLTLWTYPTLDIPTPCHTHPLDVLPAAGDIWWLCSNLIT